MKSGEKIVLHSGGGSLPIVFVKDISFDRDILSYPQIIENLQLNCKTIEKYLSLS